MLKAERKTQAQTCYEVLVAEGFKAYIGLKPRNKHIVSVFSADKKNVVATLDRAMHRPRYALSKLRGGVLLLNFKTGV